MTYEYMISYPIVVQVLMGKDVVSRYRKLMGVTNQLMQMMIQLGNYTVVAEENSVHGSDIVKMLE